MTTARWIRIASLLVATLTLVACEGVGTDVGNPGTGDMDVGTTDDTGSADASDAGSSTDSGAVADTAEDVGGVDVGPIEDVSPDSTMTDAGEDTPDAFADTSIDVVDDGGDAVDAVDSDAMDADEDTDIDVRSPWEPGATPATYPFGYDSVIDQIILLEDGERGRDFTGDEEPDNALGALVDTLGGVIEDLDVNGALASAIEDGSLNLGFGWPSFETESGRLPGPAEANFFTLIDPDDDPFTRSEWIVPADNFVDGTGEPRVRFVGDVDDDAVALLYAPRFVLTLLFFDIAIEVELLDAQLLGEVVPSDAGVVMDGVITGAAPVDAMWTAFNGVVTSCDCVEGGDLILGSGPDATCASLDTSACGAGDAQPCTALPEFCALARTLIVGSLDVDTDDDGAVDAFSTTLAFEANAATFSLAE